MKLILFIWIKKKNPHTVIIFLLNIINNLFFQIYKND